MNHSRNRRKHHEGGGSEGAVTRSRCYGSTLAYNPALACYPSAFTASSQDSKTIVRSSYAQAASSMTPAGYSPYSDWDTRTSSSFSPPFCVLSALLPVSSARRDDPDHRVLLAHGASLTGHQSDGIPFELGRERSSDSGHRTPLLGHCALGSVSTLPGNCRPATARSNRPWYPLA